MITQPVRRLRLSEASIAVVRHASPIVEVIGEYLQLRRCGRVFVAACPWHVSRTGRSFTVNPLRESWRCWSCSIGGDIFSFIQKLHGINFRTAAELLAARAGIAVDNHPGDTEVLSITTEIRSIDRRIAGMVRQAQIDAADELARLRAIIRTTPFDRLPSDIFDRMRRADARFALTVLASPDDATKFLSATEAEQERRINEALEEDGYVRGDRGRIYEVPLQ